MSRYYRQLIERFGYTYSSDAVASVSFYLSVEELSGGRAGYFPPPQKSTHTSPNTSQQIKAPIGCTSVSIECWGGGGSGGSVVKEGSFPNGAAGGAGGSYAFGEFEITEGQTIYLYVGGGGIASTASSTNGRRINGTQSWVNLVSNTKPTSLSQGILAVGGQGGQSRHTDAILPGIGTTAGCIGEVVFAGGNGATPSLTFYEIFNSPWFSGGGGGGATYSGNGGNANGIFGGNHTLGSGGGAGGAGRYVSGNGNVGLSPGGGGSGALLQDGFAGSYLGGNGSAGKIIFYWGTHLYPIVR